MFTYKMENRELITSKITDAGQSQYLFSMTEGLYAKSLVRSPP